MALPFIILSSKSFFVSFGLPQHILLQLAFRVLLKSVGNDVGVNSFINKY